MENCKNSVSIIMRSKNSDWVIGEALAGLYSQSFKDFELLVVDSGSTDRTLEIVKQYPCRLIEINPGSYYPGIVLNKAIEETNGEIIVFLNSDAVPLCQYSLERLIKVFEDTKVKGAYARQIPRPDAETWVVRDYELSFPDSDSAPEWITLSLPMAAIRREIWEQHRFYADAWASEDTEWGNWAKSNGYEIKYVKDAIVMHSHNYSFKQIYGRKFVEGEADVFIYNKKYTLTDMISGIIKFTLKDFVLYFRKRDFSGMWKIPGRNFIYNWAYYKGHQLGIKRKISGDSDTSKGQVTVLSRYE